MVSCRFSLKPIHWIYKNVWCVCFHWILLRKPWPMVSLLLNVHYVCSRHRRSKYWLSRQTKPNWVSFARYVDRRWDHWDVLYCSICFWLVNIPKLSFIPICLLICWCFAWWLMSRISNLPRWMLMPAGSSLPQTNTTHYIYIHVCPHDGHIVFPVG